MFIFFVLLNLCTHFLGVLSSGLQNDFFISDTVFDKDLLDNALDPELCQQQLRNMGTFEFYDASFRVPQGILQGNMLSMGNFHQCLGITQDVEGDVIEGKYCMVNAQIENLNFPVLNGKSWLEDMQWMELDVNSTNRFHKYKNALVARAGEFGHEINRVSDITVISQLMFSLALCIPKTCTVENALLPVENDINYFTEFCRLPGDKPMAPADYTAIAIFTTIGILTILSTAYDLRHRIFLKKDPGEANKVLRCCSVYTNTKSLVTFRGTPSAIDCVDGIRALSMIWVILGHTVLNFLSRYTANILEFMEWALLRKSIWVTSSLLAVDTFLTLSGSLLVYTAAKKMKQMQLLTNLHVFYLNRLLRMFPLLACAVLLQASVFHYVSDGVAWLVVAIGVSNCREYWWSALLHIQNIVNPIQYCLPHTWYLSVDVQLHILSPLILFWVLGSRRTAWSGLALGVTAAITASTVYIFLKDLSDGDDHDAYFYKNPLTRCPPFLVGIIFGYILHIYREKKLKISVWFIGLGYIVSFGVMAYCLNSHYEDRQVYQTELVLDLHRAFMRPLWGASVCWIIFACHQGYGGPINWFLSLKIWKFLARISYAMYLFHYPIIFVISGSSVVPFYFNLENLWLIFASVMVYTVITSIAACVLIEAPCTTLQNMLLTVLMPSSKTTTVKTIAPTPTAPEEIEPKHVPA